MADVFTKTKRSEVMSRIRSRGNDRTELALIRLFRAHKITGWRRHLQLRLAPGAARGGSSSRSERGVEVKVRPDFVFSRIRAVVFVDGCFWHACPQHGTKPRGNAAFWRRKFATNVARDQLVNRALRRNHWRVLRIWEHELTRKRETRLSARLRRWFADGERA